MRVVEVWLKGLSQRECENRGGEFDGEKNVCRMETDIEMNIDPAFFEETQKH